MPIPFDRCSIQLTPQLLNDADLLIVELLRHYPGGMRAEGITLAQRRFQRRRGFLVVSPLNLPQFLCPGYWDVSANDSVADRIALLASNPSLAAEQFNQVEEYFQPLLRLPPQHDD